MSNQPIAKIPSADLAVETPVFTAYLRQYGLPTDNVIASNEERAVIATNLPTLLDGLDSDLKSDARYLSKFVGATAIGLFDAALNYVWNEVVLNLRRKAALYGIDLFFDAAVGGKVRDLYKTEVDLIGLKDTVLLETCRKLELLSDVVYHKLDHILTMRNEVAASHPNVERIGAFELLGWLQTCVKDILQDKPSESAIRIGALVQNLRARIDVIDDQTTARLSNEMKNLSLPHVHNLLVTIFGIFVAPDSTQTLRLNVAKVAPAIWIHAGDQVKFKIGVQIDTYRTNLDQPKVERGHEFLQIVDGLSYESIPTKSVALDALADQLMAANQGWDNYYNEPAFIQDILRYCKAAADIPKECLDKLVTTILKCRLGRGLSYHEGVSPGARAKYDAFFDRLDDSGVTACLIALFSPSINNMLYSEIRQKHLAAILTILRRIAISARLHAAIDLLLADISKARLANHNTEFRELTKPFILWK